MMTGILAGKCWLFRMQFCRGFAEQVCRKRSIKMLGVYFNKNMGLKGFFIFIQSKKSYLTTIGVVIGSAHQGRDN